MIGLEKVNGLVTVLCNLQHEVGLEVSLHHAKDPDDVGVLGCLSLVDNLDGNLKGKKDRLLKLYRCRML